MSAQRQELQFIPVERNGYYERGRVVEFRETARDRQRREVLQQKKRKRQLRRRRMHRRCVIGICAVILMAACYKTNWFTDLPLIGKTAKIERLQKQEDIPAELIELVGKNEETYNFVKDYSYRENYKNQTIDLSKDYQIGSVPLLMQWDKRWGYDLYGEAMIGLSGCGPTCMTMAYLYHTGDTTMNPRKMAEYAQEAGYHSSEGTSWDFWTEGAAELGLCGEEISLNETIMKSVLDSGGLIVCSMSPGDFTDGGHYILVRGYDEKGFFVNDPNRKVIAKNSGILIHCKDR